MSIYKSYKTGFSIRKLAEDNGLRTTYNSLRHNLGKKNVRLKNNRIQILDTKNRWAYRT
jgi:hypothetical protein